jgi:glutamate/tyrosine decarboxylase-like PLP-dependent enzyme
MGQTPRAEARAIEEGSASGESSLDPAGSAEWGELRTQAHRMLDDMLDFTQGIDRRPVWQPIPTGLRQRFRGALPSEPTELSDVHAEFLEHILPFGPGNVHPGFMGWAQGGGSPVGMLAEMLAAGLNANLGGRDHAPIEVEHQVTEWMRQLFGFPAGASGLCVTGTSTANLIAVKIARDRVLGQEVRSEGCAASGRSDPAPRLRCYGSAALHACVAKALDVTGLGTEALRSIPTNARGQMEPDALREAILADRSAGFTPFLVVGSAGTVDTGAIDDLDGIADICKEEEIWLHVDGAFGALAMLAPDLAPRLAGIERADSIAFDFHKWGQVPYDAGFLLVRDGRLQREAFRPVNAPYLARETRGMAAGESWPCDLGIELSRGFRALKVWFTFKTYGARAIGALISESCRLARYLEERIRATAELEVLAPVELNIVCFGYRSERANEVNRMIAINLQERGRVAPSMTTLNGRVAIRAALFNHRTGRDEVDTLVEQTLLLGRALESAELWPGSERRVTEDNGSIELPDPLSLAIFSPGMGRIEQHQTGRG